MKRFYKILLPALVFALALGGCRAAQPASTAGTAAGAAQAEAAESTTSAAAEGTTAPHTAVSAEYTTNSDSAASAQTSAQSSLTKPGTAAAQPGTSAAKPTSAPASGTVTQPAGSTSPAGTIKPTAAAKPSTTTTKPSGSGSHTGTTARPATTTKPAQTTAAPVAKGNRISGKITYLNEAGDYAAKLNAEKLKNFGLPADKQKDVLAHPEKYTFYSLDILLENKESVPVTLYYLDVKNNGTDGVYINGDTSGDIGLPVGGKMTNRFYVLAPAEDADGFVMTKIREMEMRVQYAATQEDDSAPVQYVYSKIG